MKKVSPPGTQLSSKAVSGFCTIVREQRHGFKSIINVRGKRNSFQPLLFAN
jgi:hypothetical protein